MAPWPGNKYSLAFGKQTAKGTPAASGTNRIAVTSGGFTPKRDILQLAETDSSRQAGKSLVVGAHTEATFGFYVRPSEIGLFTYGLLGANADSGAGPFVHTATIADAPPYFTVWETFGGVVISKYQDVRFTSLQIAGQAGGALTAQVSCYGLSATFGSADDTSVLLAEDPLVYPQVTVTKAGATPHTIDQFQVTLANNGGAIQADNGLIPFDYVVGKLDVSGMISLLAQDDTDFRKFHTGTTSGTAFAQTLDTESLAILAQVSANLSLQFLATLVEYTEYPIAPTVDGSPVKVAMGFRTRRDDTTPANYAKFITTNSVTTY